MWYDKYRNNISWIFHSNLNFNYFAPSTDSESNAHLMILLIEHDFHNCNKNVTEIRECWRGNRNPWLCLRQFRWWVILTWSHKQVRWNATESGLPASPRQSGHEDSVWLRAETGVLVLSLEIIEISCPASGITRTLSIVTWGQDGKAAGPTSGSETASPKSKRPVY